MAKGKDAHTVMMGGYKGNSQRTGKLCSHIDGNVQNFLLQHRKEISATSIYSRHMSSNLAGSN